MSGRSTHTPAPTSSRSVLSLPLRRVLFLAALLIALLLSTAAPDAHATSDSADAVTLSTTVVHEGELLEVTADFSQSSWYVPADGPEVHAYHSRDLRFDQEAFIVEAEQCEIIHANPKFDGCTTAKSGTWDANTRLYTFQYSGYVTSGRTGKRDWGLFFVAGSEREYVKYFEMRVKQARIVSQRQQQQQDASLPEVGVYPLSTPMFEGGRAAFAIIVVPRPTVAFQVRIDITDASGSDFIDPPVTELGDTITLGEATGEWVTIPFVPSDQVDDEDPGYLEIQIPTVDDNIVETSGDITVAISPLNTYRITDSTGVAEYSDDEALRRAKGSAKVRVNDDDSTLPSLSISGGDAIDEGDEAVFTISSSRTLPALTELIVKLEATDVVGSDFLATETEGDGLKAVIEAGESSVQVRLPTIADSVDEASGEITLRLVARDEDDAPAVGRGYVIDSQSSATVRVSDDDGLPSGDSVPSQEVQQLVEDTAQLEADIQARIDLTAKRGDRHSERIWRGALAAVRGEQPSGIARKVDAAFAQRLANRHAAKGRAELSDLWQSIADAVRG